MLIDYAYQLLIVGLVLLLGLDGLVIALRPWRMRRRVRRYLESGCTLAEATARAEQDFGR